MNNKTKDIYFIIIFFILFFLILTVSLYSLNFLFGKVEPEKNVPIIFRDIIIQDTYNSSYYFDIELNTDGPEFLVKNKIRVNVFLQGIKNNNPYQITLVYFAFVTSDGYQMPFQTGSFKGLEMNETTPFNFELNYDTYINFSSKYSCRLTLQFVNITDELDIDVKTEEIYIGPVLEIHPSSVGLQIEMITLQREANKRTIGLAMILVVLTLVTIIITWIEKHNDLMNKLDNFFNRSGKIK